MQTFCFLLSPPKLCSEDKPGWEPQAAAHWSRWAQEQARKGVPNEEPAIPCKAPQSPASRQLSHIRSMPEILDMGTCHRNGTPLDPRLTLQYCWQFKQDEILNRPTALPQQRSNSELPGSTDGKNLPQWEAASGHGTCTEQVWLAVLRSGHVFPGSPLEASEHKWPQLSLC